MTEITVAENEEDHQNWMLELFDEITVRFIKRGNLSRVVKLFDEFNAASTPEQQFDINIRSDYGDSSTLLHIAAARGELEYVNWLLKKGATWQINDIGDTPLHLAVGRRDYMEDYSFTDSFKLNSSVNVVSTLLQHLVDIGQTDGMDEWNKRNLWMKSPLDYSVRLGGAEVLKLFISKGARVNGPLFRTQYGEIPDDARGTFQYTSGPGPGDMGDNLYTQFGTSLLHQAIAYNNMDAFEVLMTDGANTRVYDDKGETPLMCAVFHMDVEAVRQLLASPGIDVSQIHGHAFEYTTDVGTFPGNNPEMPQRQYTNWNALHCLASIHWDTEDPLPVEVMWMLLNADVDVRAKTNLGLTPLDMARANNNEKMSSALERWEHDMILRNDAVLMALHKRLGERSNMKHVPPELFHKFLNDSINF